MQNTQIRKPIGKISKYDVMEEIGHGGFSTVYLCYQPDIKVYYALKMLNRNRDLVSIDDRNLFLREVQMLSKIKCLRVVDISDWGTTEKGINFIVMDFVKGKTLKQEVEEKIKEGAHGIFWKQALDYTRQICESLLDLSSKNIVHRDIKPSNIIIDKDNDPIILDLGIAREISTHNNDQTSFTKIQGSCDFIAPERTLGKTYPLDISSDIYSLGCTVFYMIEGRKPFTGIIGHDGEEDKISLIQEHRVSKRPRINVFGVPSEVKDLVKSMMAIDHDERPSLQDIIKEIRSILNKNDIDHIHTPQKPIKKRILPKKSKGSNLPIYYLGLAASFLLLVSVVLIFVLVNTKNSLAKHKRINSKYTKNIELLEHKIKSEKEKNNEISKTNISYDRKTKFHADSLATGGMNSSYSMSRNNVFPGSFKIVQEYKGIMGDRSFIVFSSIKDKVAWSDERSNGPFIYYIWRFKARAVKDSVAISVYKTLNGRRVKMESRHVTNSEWAIFEHRVSETVKDGIKKVGVLVICEDDDKEFCLDELKFEVSLR